jgi:hypothetical protein
MRVVPAFEPFERGQAVTSVSKPQRNGSPVRHLRCRMNLSSQLLPYVYWMVLRRVLARADL